MLHGHFVQQTEEVGNEDRWKCLRNGILNHETGSLIFPAQEQAIQTTVIKEKIDKSQEQTIGRMYSRADETLNHIARECSRLAERECKRRNDRIGRCIHLKICRASAILFKSKWYEYQTKVVIVKDCCKILCDFAAQTDYFTTARRPDMIFIDKKLYPMRSYTL